MDKNEKLKLGDIYLAPIEFFLNNSEKLKRVKSLMSDEAKVKDESMRDSLLDLANYAILTIMELDKTKK